YLIAFVMVVLVWLLIALFTGVFSAGRGIRNLLLVRRVPTLRRLQDMPSTTSIPVLAQLSDVHQTAAGDIPVEIRAHPGLWPTNEAPPTGQETRTRLRRLLSRIRNEGIATIAITGDLTDGGRAHP